MAELKYNAGELPHLLFTPQQVARSVLAGLKNRSTLARIVNQDYAGDFVPGTGATVTVKRPVMVDKARTYTKAQRDAEEAITYSRLFEPYTSIKIEDQIYNAVKLPDDFAAFTLTDMEQQVLAPMAESVAEAVNEVVVNAINGAPYGLSTLDTSAKGAFVGVNKSGGTAAENDPFALKKTEHEFIGIGVGLSEKAKTSPVTTASLTAKTNADVLKVIRAARTLFQLRGVPQQGRYLVVGASWSAALLSQPNLFKANEAGTDGLLREATLGKLYGFTIVEDMTINPLDAYALQREAVTLVTRTAPIPRGVAFGTTTAEEGFSLRYLHDYDADHLQDRAITDIFAGAHILDGQRIVRLKGEAGIEEPAEPTTATAAAGTPAA